MCGSGVDVASSLLLISAILMAVGEQPFHLSRCPNFRNRLTFHTASNHYLVGLDCKTSGLALLGVGIPLAIRLRAFQCVEQDVQIADHRHDKCVMKSSMISDYALYHLQDRAADKMAIFRRPEPAPERGPSSASPSCWQDQFRVSFRFIPKAVFRLAPGV